MAQTIVDSLLEENKNLKETNSHLQTQLDCLKSELQLLKRERFGAKSERFEEIPPEQLVFNELEELGLGQNPNPTPTQTISYKRRMGRQKRKALPDNLEREEVVIDIAEDQKSCPHDGHRLKVIGEEVSQKLKSYPARTVVLIEKKKKYACAHFDGHMVQAKSNSILPKTMATPELLSYLIFSKFFQGLPLYRLEELYELQGIELSRGIMARWLIQISEKLMPLWNNLEDRVLESRYMSIDATTIQVLKEKGRSPQTKSFMWVRGSPEQKIALFDYDLSGAGKVARRLVTGFKGALQADAHKGYEAIDRDKIKKLGCLMHSRRRFEKAWILGKKKPGLAEDGYKEKGLSVEERHAARLIEVGPYLEKMRLWALGKKEKVLKASPIGNAIYYFLNEYEELTAFLSHGRYEPDNGWVERVIRKFAIGRNNWLFSDTVEGAQASSLLYSLVITAKLNGVDPFKAMVEILNGLPNAQTADDFKRLSNYLFVRG